MRHMHDYGTTSEQLAWIKVAASHHAQWNPHAMLREVVTVEDVLNSPMIADPLHRLDCCVVTDGGGAVIVTTPEVAKSLKRPLVKVIGHGEATKGPRGGKDLDLTYSGRRLVRPARVRGSRRHADRHQVRLDLRQLHHHRADAARGPRLLQEGRGRQVRRRRQPDLGRRQAAVQHRRRRALQQPPDQPRRHHQDHRGGAPGPRRGASRRCRCRTAISSSPTAPAARSAPATAPHPASWKGNSMSDVKKTPTPDHQSRKPRRSGTPPRRAGS